LIDKIFKVIFSFFIIALVARYLGVEQFGLFNYLMTIVLFFVALTSFGFNGTVVRELVDKKTTVKEVLVTSFLTQFVGSLLFYLCIYIFLCFYNFQFNDYILLLSFAIIFKSSDIARYYYEYKLQMKKAVIVDNVILLLSGLLKIYVISAEGDLLFFVAIALTEYMLAALLLLSLIIRDVKLSIFDFNSDLAIKLIIKGAPLIISSMSIILLMRIDTIMIEHYIGLQAVGFYSSATKLSEFWFFIPYIIAQSFGTKIYELKKNNEHNQLVEKLLGFSFAFSLVVAGLVSVLSPYLIDIVYGAVYAPSSIVLSIHIWSGCFVFISVISGRWLLAENLQATAMGRTLLGVAVNISLNVYMIPAFGIEGAAISTLIGFAVGSYIGNLFSRHTRPLFFIQTKAMLFIFMPQKYTEVLNFIRKLRG
jgi:PST family polysaccharide transporter